MAVFVDFVGLNTLVEEPVDVNTNTVGNFIESKASGSTRFNAGRGDAYPEYSSLGTPSPQALYGPNDDGTFPEELRNKSIQTINGEDYLAALNLHRNGPYGFPIFKQLRAGQSPTIRRQRLTNIFSHYEFPGQTLTLKTGRNTRNFTVVTFLEIPTDSSSLAITLGGTTYTVEFNRHTMTSTFDGETNKLLIDIGHADIRNLRSDHDRVRVIMEKIKAAIKALNLDTLSHVMVHSAAENFKQARLTIVAKNFGSDVEVSSVYTHQPQRANATFSYSGAMSNGDSLTFNNPKLGNFSIRFTTGTEPSDTTFVLFGGRVGRVNISIEDNTVKTAAAVATLLNTIPGYTATSITDYVIIQAAAADKNYNFTLAEVDSGNKQTIPSYIAPGASAQDRHATVINHKGTTETIARLIPQRRGPVEHYNEVPVVSRHKPLRMIGSVTTRDPQTNKDVLERVEVFTTLGNETTHFSNGKLNKFYGTEGYISEDYEDFVDLYLEGAVDGDESPIDEFRYLSYKQVVYPKEIYTYKNHTRNRINFVSRYWRDTRNNRTELDVNNGFGFHVHSQSAWVLDAEQDFKNLTYQITPGRLYFRHPNRFRNKISIVSGTIDSTAFHAGKRGSDDGAAYSTTYSSASTETFTFPDSGTGHADERSISHVPLGDKRLVLPANVASQPKYFPISGLCGYPNSRTPTLYGADAELVKQYISINPFDTSTKALWRYGIDTDGGGYGGGATATDHGSAGLRKAFETRGFSLGDDAEGTGPKFHHANCRLHKVHLGYNRGLAIMSDEYDNPPLADLHEWRLKTTSSTIATWITPNGANIPGSATITNSEQKRMQLSGTLYHEVVQVRPIGGGDPETKVSKIINFDPERGGVTVKLGTVFSGSLIQGRAGSDTASRLFYIGADEPGAVEYKTNSFYDVDNPIYHAAKNWNPRLRSGDGDSNNANRARFVAATSMNHFVAELDLSGSHPAFGLAKDFASGQSSPNSRNEKILARGQHFVANHAHNNTGTNREKDPNGYARIYVNGSSSYVATQYDPYKFLGGSHAEYQEQLSGSDGVFNSSIKLAEITTARSDYWLENDEFVSINPFNSNGFSFSYWIKFGQDPESFTSKDNLIFSIQDEDGNPIIDHSIGGKSSPDDNIRAFRVGFRNKDGELSVWQASRTDGYATNAWYNITFSLKNDGLGNMVGDVKTYRKNILTEPTTWDSKAWLTAEADEVTLTPARWGKINKSKKLFVLPAGSSHQILRTGYDGTSTPSATDLDNVNIDGLAFWNGGLSDHQMKSMLSSSVHQNDDGYPGDGPPSMDPARFPGTDTSIAVESLGTPTFRHARRLYEMNTHQNSPGIRKEYDDIRPGRCFQRGDKYFPLGVNHSPAQFQSQVINAGTNGQMDYAFWFKVSHQNYRNRSIRFVSNNSTTDANRPILFNSNLSNRRDHHKGFFISFWWRRNGEYSTTKHTNILSCKNDRWGICVTPDSATAITNDTEGQRKLAFWLNPDPEWLGYNHAVHDTADNSNLKQMMFLSNTLMPEDNEFHYCSVHWNGKMGLEAAVQFHIDSAAVLGNGLRRRPVLIANGTYNSKHNADTPLGVLGSFAGFTNTSISFDSDTIGDYKHSVHIINPAPDFNLHGHEFTTANSNIAHLTVIEDPLDPLAFAPARTVLYNNGQRSEVGNNGFKAAGESNRISDILASLEDTGHEYEAGYITYHGPGHNADAKIINAAGGQVGLYTNPDTPSGLATTYNFRQSRLFYMNVTAHRKPYFKYVTPNNGVSIQLASKSGGYSIAFDFAPRSGYHNHYRTHDDDIMIIEARDSSGNRVFSLFKPSGNINDLHGYCYFKDGGISKFEFINAQARLFNGRAHSIMFTTRMETNGAGVPINANLYIDNELMATSHKNVKTSMAKGGVHTASSPKTICLFGQSDGSETMPESFYLARVKMYRQYLGGSDTNSINIRKAHIAAVQRGLGAGFGGPDVETGVALRNGADFVRVFGGSEQRCPMNRVYDSSFYLPTAMAAGAGGFTVSLADGATTEMNVFLPAFVDCPLANYTAGDVAQSENMGEITVRNLAFKVPKIIHHYRLGSERELQDVPLFTRLREPLLENRRDQICIQDEQKLLPAAEAASTHGTYVSGSQLALLDSGPRHWNIDNWGGGTGDVDTNGVVQPRNAQQREQTLFFSGDHRDDSHPRDSYAGVELSLSASGGGYYLISAVGTAGAPNQVRRSHENLIIPDRWYYVYGQYKGLNNDITEKIHDNIYLNGKAVEFPTYLQASGSGDYFDEFTRTGTNPSYYPLSLGGIRGSNRFGFSGFIQDFALWSTNQPDTNGDGVPDIANSGRNTWDGMRPGSSYIDTDNPQLLLAAKMGYLEGHSSAKITKVAGTLTTAGTRHDGLSSTNRAYVSGPPIEWYRSTTNGALNDNGGTIISFWLSMSDKNEKGIIGFNSDLRFPIEYYKEYADNHVGWKNKSVDYADTSGIGLKDASTHRQVAISIEKVSASGAYKLRFKRMRFYDEKDFVSSGDRADWFLLKDDTLTSTGLSSTPPLNTLFHNTIMLTKNEIKWYINGQLAATQSFNTNFTDNSNMWPQQYPVQSSNPTWKHFVNGWNNITLLDEDDAFTAGSKIDEVAILFYNDLETQSDSAQNATATALYNGGMVYDYSARKQNLFAWWRMGENNLASNPLTEGATIPRHTQLDDESERPQYDRHHLTVLHGGRAKAVQRTGLGNTDLKNYYAFNQTDPDNPTIPFGRTPGTVSNANNRTIDCSINTPNQQLAFNGSMTGWGWDYSFDSYKLYPFGWLATEGIPTEVYLLGRNYTDGNTRGMGRLRYDYGNGKSTNSYAALADTAIFTGVSNHYGPLGRDDDTSQTRAVTKIKFGDEMPDPTDDDAEVLPVTAIVGDTLVLIVNPREVAGGGVAKDGKFRELRIEFTRGSGAATSTAFTNPTWASRPNARIAYINVSTATTIPLILDALQALLTDVSNDHGLSHDHGAPTGVVNPWSVTHDDATKTLTITADDGGGDGKWEIIGKYEGQGNDKRRVDISSTVGASHISKALTRGPGFGWVQQNDSDFTRGVYTNTFLNGTSGSHGLMPTMVGSTPVVKPYWYHLETTNYSRNRVGDYNTNIGTSAGKFNIVNPDSKYSFRSLTKYTENYALLDSGSMVEMAIKNTPQLDFNDIRIHSGSFLSVNMSGSTTNFISPRAPKALIGGTTGASARFGPGILQNSYSQFAQTIEQGADKFIDHQFSASACYFRRHSLTASTSFVAPNSGFLQKLSASQDDSNYSTVLLGDISASHLFLGSAKWEAGDFAGYHTDEGTFVFKPKKPFFDDYGKFIEEARPLMKDYGVVPEFRISDHVTSYLTRGATEQKLDFLNITGGLASADTSNKKDFFEIYSTSDFLKHFEMVQDDHSDFVDPFAIRLRCSVVKKFLPYEGFYPAQRTVQVAQQFHRSYAANINTTASLKDDGTKRYNLSTKRDYGFQYLLAPLFAPGIMYNTIKSGVAVDYPLITDTGSVKRLRYYSGSELVPGGAAITEQFDTRIPFEALIEPEKHLANITLTSNEPDENAQTNLEVEWGGEGDQLYNLMISNFLAETSEFFLENKSFTSLASLSQGDPNFGNAKAGNIYMMRLKMFRSTSGQKPVAKNRLSKSYGVPQDQGTMQETFTMYSRPSAFGPPQFLSGSDFTATTWSDFKFDGTSGSLYIDTDGNPFRNLKPLPFQHDFSYVTGSTYGAYYNIGTEESTDIRGGAIGNQAHLGFNYPFTPPYYHGEAWADITFIPTESKKYTLQEIINQSSVEFYRYFAGSGSIGGNIVAGDTFPGPGDTTVNIDDQLALLKNDHYTIEGNIGNRIHHGGGRSTLSHVHDRTVVINDQAMQIASSVNIFSQGVLEQDISTQVASGITNTTNVQVDTDLTNKYRWIIQTKFETPMLNFNNYTYGKHTTGDTNANGTVRKAPHRRDADPVVTLPNYTDNSYGIELPGVAPMQTPIGMWHQYGHLPQNSKEGVFLQVDDVPKSWIRNAMNRLPPIAKRHRSLATLCGFSTEPVRMGEVAGVKEISEAVVAIPFFEKAGRRRFFTMEKRQIRLALDPSRKNLVGRTVVDMVEKMQKFVMPPSLDFVANPEIKPFSMYIFEFNHNLTKRDLADIWQNLPPELTQTVQTDEVSISHQLLAYELLGRGGRYRRGRNQEVELVRNDRAESINPEIQWMVFKVKQRAKTNYFEKIFARNESQQLLSERVKLGVSADALGRKNRVSYNWPYDFFSMIEGVKLNAEVHFLDFDEEASQAQEKPVIKPKTKDTDKNREKRTAPARRLLGAVSGKVPPDKLKKTPEEVDKKPKRKKGKITRKRRIKTVIKKPDNRKKKLNNAFDRKKIK